MPLPAHHQRFLDRASATLREDDRLLGLAVAGSYVTGAMDEWSDLDLVVVVREEQFDAVMAQRREIAGKLGHLVAAFTGEHVGEPRLLVCLFDDPILHVDLKFVTLNGLGQRVDDPVVLWERDGRVAEALSGSRGGYPELDWQWAEDRVWTWMHYAAMKLARGEILEIANFPGFLWQRALGPMAKYVSRRPGDPVTPAIRRLETEAPEWIGQFEATLPRSLDRAEVARAVLALMDLYCALRDHPRGQKVTRAVEAERVARAYWKQVLG